MSLPDGMNYLSRPVLSGLCHYESMVDGSLDLYDFAEMNDWLDVRDENDRRMKEANKQSQ